MALACEPSESFCNGEEDESDSSSKGEEARNDAHEQESKTGGDRN